MEDTAPSLSRASATGAVDQAPPVESEDDVAQINDYMAGLLQRYGATPDAAGAEPPPREKPQPPSKPTAKRAPEPARPKEVPAPQQSSEFLPRATAPEREFDLRALRQLANMSARGAIQSCDCDRLISVAYGKLLLAGTAIAAAFYLMNSSTIGPAMTSIAIVISAFLAVLWSVQYHLVVRKASRMAAERAATAGDSTAATSAATQNVAG